MERFFRLIVLEVPDGDQLALLLWARDKIAPWREDICWGKHSSVAKIEEREGVGSSASPSGARPSDLIAS